MKKRKINSSEREDWPRRWLVNSSLSGCQRSTNSLLPIIFVITCSGCQSTWTSEEESIPFPRIAHMSVRTGSVLMSNNRAFSCDNSGFQLSVESNRY